MSDQPDAQDAEQALDDMLQELMPALEWKRRAGLIFAVAVSGVAIALTVWIWTSAMTDDQLVAIAPAFIGVAILFSINGWVAKGQQRMVLPHMAKAIGLDYEQNGREFLRQVPGRLLPRANVNRAEDWIRSNVGNRPFELAEVKAETGGKHSKTLFRGLVVQFENTVPIPPFFMAPERKTGGWFSRMKVDDLVQVDSVTGRNGEVYGVWLSQKGAERSHPTLRAVIDLLTDLETQIGSSAKLFSATSNGDKLHIALSQFRDMFKVGGLLANRKKIMAGITDAFEDLNVPLRIVSALLEVERASGQSE